MIEIPNRMAYVNNYAIRYLDFGVIKPVKSEATEVLLLLHGIGASAERWLRVVPLLNRYFRIIIPDIVGFGYSDKPTVEYTMNFFVEFIRDFLKSIRIQRTHVIGSSFGGLLAAEFAMKFTSIVKKMILVSPAGTMKTSTKTLDEYILAALYPTMENARRAFSDMAYDSKVVTDDIVKDFVNRMKLPNSKYAFMSTLLGIRNTQDLDTKLTKIRSPTLLIWGRDDKMIPSEHVVDYLRIQNSRLIVIPNSGHTPYTETPSLFAKVALDFLNASQ
ncbi:MAG TPA: alpha/beta hydrolase [Nitrososphaeraceae archaeon]